jgi:hypothetical protein
LWLPGIGLRQQPEDFTGSVQTRFPVNSAWPLCRHLGKCNVFFEVDDHAFEVRNQARTQRRELFDRHKLGSAKSKISANTS